MGDFLSELLPGSFLPRDTKMNKMNSPFFPSLETDSISSPFFFLPLDSFDGNP